MIYNLFGFDRGPNYAIVYDNFVFMTSFVITGISNLDIL